MPLFSAFVGAAWLLAALTASAADDYPRAPDWLLVVNQGLLVPASFAAVTTLGVVLGGPRVAAAFGISMLALPAAGLAYSLPRYRETFLDAVLTQAMGIGDGARFTAGALLLLAVTGAILSLHDGAPTVPLAAAAGAAAGGAALLETVSAVVLLGVLPAYALARRFVDGAVFGAVATVPLVAVALTHGLAVDLSWGAVVQTDAGLREFLWSNRLLEWLPLAGVVAAWRLSAPLALMLGGWVGGMALAAAAGQAARVDDGSFFIALIPAFPGLALLVACLPLLVPTAAATLRRREKKKPPSAAPVAGPRR
ncbi:MAG: hypothetical protein H0T13_08405 [Actinobacteria bacterium]|nr:hypothetical protein [Actinomycetota bacterium]